MADMDKDIQEDIESWRQAQADVNARQGVQGLIGKFDDEGDQKLIKERLASKGHQVG